MKMARKPEKIWKENPVRSIVDLTVHIQILYGIFKALPSDKTDIYRLFIEYTCKDPIKTNIDVL